MVSVRGLMVFVFLLLLIGGVFGEEVVIGDDAEAFGEKIIGLDDARLKAQYWSALSVQGKGEEFQKKVFDKLEYPDTYNIYLLLTNDEERNTFLEFAHNELREVIIWGEIQRNSNAPIILISLENEDYRSLKINDGRIIITDDDNIEHFIPTKDITGFKKISFSKIEKGGKGYAVHYLAGDEKSGAILSSGFLKNAGDGKWDVVEEGKRVGALSFGNEPKNAIYFRGVPNNKDGVSFSKGDYVWREKGRGSDVSFVYADGTTISADEGDITNEDGRYCGYVNEKGMRGASEIGGVKVRSIHKNNVGFKFGDKVIGSGSDSVVEIKKKSGGDIEVSFPSNVRNVEVVNPDGNVFVGKLQVTDRIKFQNSFLKGIGRAKGFGFGFFQIIPLQTK